MSTIETAEDVFALLSERDAQGPAAWLEPAAADALVRDSIQVHAQRAGLPEPKLRRGLVVLWGTAGVVLLTGAASAMVLMASMDASVKPGPAPAVVPTEGGTRVALKAPSLAAPVPSQESIVAAPVKPTTPTLISPKAQIDATRADTRPTPPDDLLQKASQLRREGDSVGAARVYQQIVSRYPRTASAYAALVSLAAMRSAAHPADALALYKEAQASRPNGALDLEIRMSMARLYRSTGDRTNEAEQLTVIADRYPESSRGAAARQRLRELGIEPQ